jgi:hypothetical protein
MSRAEQLRNMTPQLIADVTLYRTDEGGRRSPAFPGDEFLPRKRPKSGNLGDALTLALEQRILQADDFWPRRPITLAKQAFATSGTGCRGEWGTERKLRNADSAVAPFAADE